MTLPSSKGRTSVTPVLGREEVADRKAPIRAPAVGDLSHLVVGGKVIEAVLALNCTPQRKVAREKDVGPIERDEQEPTRRPRPDAGNLGETRLDLFVSHLREH